MHPRVSLAAALFIVASMPACSSESDDAPSKPAPPQDAATEEAGEEASAEAAADQEAEPDGSYSDIDASADAEGEAAAPVAIAFPATQGETQPGFGLAASGAGQKRLESLNLLQNTGTLTLVGAAHRGLAYQMHDWEQAGFVLYDVLSIAEDGSDLAVTYLYCQGTNLPYAYTESLLHPMDWESTTGTCEGTDTPVTATADLPALNVTTEPIDTGIAIQGSDLQLGPAGGNIVLAGKPWQLVPFNTVDCSKDCPGGSWYEIHTLLKGDQEGCFAILYLYPASPASVQVSYAVCLPSLERPPTAIYQATWTGSVQPKLQPMMWRPSPPLPAPDSEWHFAP